MILSRSKTLVFMEALNFCSKSSISRAMGAFIVSSRKGIQRNNTEGFLSVETFEAF
jgi:hypothetical protein